MTAPILPYSAYALTFTGPDAQEQLMVELINRARLDPQAEVGISGDSIASGASTTPVEALAVVPELDAAAQKHSDAMLTQDFFAHTNPFTGKDPFERMRDEGYNYRSAGENISWISINSYSADQITRHHENLWASDGHQRNILSASYSEIGIGYSAGPGGNYLTQNFGDRGLTYLTGVIIDDLDNDQFYDVGEGQGAVRITAYNENGAYATSTWDAGGYSLELPNGTYTVVMEGGDLDGIFETQVTISGQNVKLDVIEGVDTTDTPAGPPGEDPNLGIPGDATTTEILRFGNGRRETLETDDDTDWFQLNLAANQTVSVYLFGVDHDTSNTLGAMSGGEITIYDSRGNVVASLDPANTNVDFMGNPSSVVEVTATQAGTYYVEAATSQQGGAGDYGLSVVEQVPVDSIPGDTSTPETIGAGETRFETLENGRDTDWFQLDLAVNQTVSVVVFGYDHDTGNGIDAMSDNDITIYDSSGNVVASVARANANADYLGFTYSYLDVTATQAGTYYVEASTSRQAGAGDYGVSVLSTGSSDPIPGDGTTTETIGVGEARYATLETGADTDWFQLDLSAGQTVSVLMFGYDHDGRNGIAAADDLDITIYDSAGNVVASVDPANANADFFGIDYSYLDVTASLTGTYYIETSASVQQGGAGDYGLMVAGQQSAANTTAQRTDLNAGLDMSADMNEDDVDDLVLAVSDHNPYAELSAGGDLATGASKYDLPVSAYEPMVDDLAHISATTDLSIGADFYI